MGYPTLCYGEQLGKMGKLIHHSLLNCPHMGDRNIDEKMFFLLKMNVIFLFLLGKSDWPIC